MRGEGEDDKHCEASGREPISGGPETRLAYCPVDYDMRRGVDRTATAVPGWFLDDVVVTGT